MKFEKISQEDREKLERRLYKTIVEEFRREKIKDGYYKYIVSLQEFKFITDITDNELKESISIAVDTMEELKKINNNDGMNKKKLKEIQDKEHRGEPFETLNIWNAIVLCVGSYEPIVPRNFCRIDKKEFENSFTLNILENIRQSMEELINTEGKEKVFEFLKNLLGKKYAQRKLFAEEDNLYGTVAAGSLYLLPVMLGKTYSLITGEEFWKTWEKLDFGTGYEDIIRPKNDVLPIKGTEEDIEFYRALGKQNEDELMRYKGDKELMLSDNMQNSIERWKRAYGQVTEKEIKKLEMEKALKKLLEDFFYVWNFRVLDTAFVREFLKHKNDDRYKRAMIVLIELMDKETKYFPELTKREANIWLIREIRDADEMIEINAYLGMLRNHLRRKEILGF